MFLRLLVVINDRLEFLPPFFLRIKLKLKLKLWYTLMTWYHAYVFEEIRLSIAPTQHGSDSFSSRKRFLTVPSGEVDGSILLSISAFKA